VLPLQGADRLGRLLEYTREWNTNSRHCDVAAAALNAVLTTHSPATLAALPNVHDLASALQVRP
jgi:U3 small nucleolar RNA-associated protein 13